MFKCSSVQVFKCSSVPSVQVFKCASVQVCKGVVLRLQNADWLTLGPVLLVVMPLLPLNPPDQLAVEVRQARSPHLEEKCKRVRHLDIDRLD